MSELRCFTCVPLKKSSMHRCSRKRPFTEVQPPGIRKTRVSRERSGEAPVPIPMEDCPQVMSPPAKRRRTATDEEVQAPWSCCYSKATAVTVTERVSLTKTNSLVQQDINMADAPQTSAPHPKPPIKINRTLCVLPYSKTKNNTPPVAQKKVMEAKANIWIIGSSYVLHGETAAFDCFGPNFGLNAEVKWFGKGGLWWNGVLPLFYRESSTQSAPDILVVHAGGNDLGLVPAKKLAFEMVKDLMELHKKFPSMKILFSCINERQEWRYGKASVINADRSKVNSLVIKAVQQLGGEVVEHPLLRYFKKNLYLHDGVHLSQEGNRIFVSAIQQVLKKMLYISMQYFSSKTAIRFSPL